MAPVGLLLQLVQWKVPISFRCGVLSEKLLLRIIDTVPGEDTPLDENSYRTVKQS